MKYRLRSKYIGQAQPFDIINERDIKCYQNLYLFARIMHSFDYNNSQSNLGLSFLWHCLGRINEKTLYFRDICAYWICSHRSYLAKETTWIWNKVYGVTVFTGCEGNNCTRLSILPLCCCLNNLTLSQMMLHLFRPAHIFHIYNEHAWCYRRPMHNVSSRKWLHLLAFTNRLKESVQHCEEYVMCSSHV
jgi:hypothetical protein